MTWISREVATTTREPWMLSITGVVSASGGAQDAPAVVRRENPIWLPPAARKRVYVQYTLPVPLSAAIHSLSRKSVTEEATITGMPQVSTAPEKLPLVTATVDVTPPS